MSLRLVRLKLRFVRWGCMAWIRFSRLVSVRQILLMILGLELALLMRCHFCERRYLW